MDKEIRSIPKSVVGRSKQCKNSVSPIETVFFLLAQQLSRVSPSMSLPQQKSLYRGNTSEKRLLNIANNPSALGRRFTLEGICFLASVPSETGCETDG